MAGERRRNEDRADQVNDVLESYHRLSGNDPNDQVTDLLADVLHWCNVRNVSFPSMLKTAFMHYCAELTEEGQAIH
jgi:hypothetical protein